MLLNLIGYCIIPISTLLYAYQSNWLTSNFSAISQTANRQMIFFIWGLLIVAYFYYLLTKIIGFLPNPKHEQGLLIAAMFYLLLALYLPYAPDRVPFQSVLHVSFASIATILFLICLYLVMLKLYYYRSHHYRPYPIALTGITCISLLLLVYTRIISSAVEIFFVISCSILLRRLELTTLKQN